MNAHVKPPVMTPKDEDLLNLVLAIRNNLHTAGIGPFSDIPELAQAYSLARIAADLAQSIKCAAAEGRRL